MNATEIEKYLQQNSEEIIKIESLEKLYEIFLDLTIIKSELHKLIHFCIDDYERKQFFSLIDLANSQQNICEKKIKSIIYLKKENLKLDFEIEKKYIENDLKKFKSEAILFKNFCKELLPKNQFSQIQALAKHCASLNLTVGKYISGKMFNQIDLKDEEDDPA